MFEVSDTVALSQELIWEPHVGNSCGLYRNYGPTKTTEALVSFILVLRPIVIPVMFRWSLWRIEGVGGGSTNEV